MTLFCTCVDRQAGRLAVWSEVHGHQVRRRRAQVPVCDGLTVCVWSGSVWLPLPHGCPVLPGGGLRLPPLVPVSDAQFITFDTRYYLHNDITFTVFRRIQAAARKFFP